MTREFSILITFTDYRSPTNDVIDWNSWCEVLIILGLIVNFFYNIHSFDHSSECGVTLSVGIVFSSVIISWLIAYTNKKFCVGSAGFKSCKRDGTILMLKVRLISRLVW